MNERGAGDLQSGEEDFVAVERRMQMKILLRSISKYLLPQTIAASPRNKILPRREVSRGGQVPLYEKFYYSSPMLSS